MRRPRHRVKSNLIWKMVGVAACINVILWPMLISLGLFKGIRQEILMPVRLISLPPSHKLPDTLQKVSRQSVDAALPPATARPPLISPRPRRSAKAVPAAADPRPTKKILIAEVKPVRPAVAHTPAHSISVPLASRPKRSVLLSPSHPAAHSRAVIVAKAPSHQAVSHPDAGRGTVMQTASAARLPQPQDNAGAVLAARKARAALLEAKGHDVAEWIAQQRAASPDQGVDAVETGHTTPAAVAVRPSDASPEAGTAGSGGQEAASVVPVKFVPAVVISQVTPVIPREMQKSAWKAKFHGRLTVNPDGTVRVEMVSSTGFPALDKLSIEAARRWKCRPATENGVPVASTRGFVIDYAVRSSP